MAEIVVDASVIVALYVEEPLSLAAEATLTRARDEGAGLHAPDLLLIECANAFWKRVQRGELDRASAMTAIAEVSRLKQLELHPLDAPPSSPRLFLWRWPTR